LVRNHFAEPGPCWEDGGPQIDGFNAPRSHPAAPAESTVYDVCWYRHFPDHTVGGSLYAVPGRDLFRVAAIHHDASVTRERRPA